MKTNELLLAAGVAALVYLALARFTPRQAASGHYPSFIRTTSGQVVGSDGIARAPEDIDMGV